MSRATTSRSSSGFCPSTSSRGSARCPSFLEHLRFFEDLCGPYPFRNEKYGIVETPHLGMEHQTCIAYGNRFRKAAFNYDWLHHHELSHEWWANLVTCRDWKDMWIHEGFGTYMQALYIEHVHGRKAYLVHMRGIRRGLNNKRAVAPRESQDTKQIYFLANGGHDNDIYQKGAWVLHSLRWVLGDQVFFEFLRRVAYPDPALEKVTDGSQVRFVDTEDVRAIAEEVADRDLGWFFEVYLRQPELPQLIEERSGKTVVLSWKVPGGRPFPMPVPFSTEGKVQRVEMPKGTVSVPLPPGGRYDVDPDDWILKQANMMTVLTAAHPARPGLSSPSVRRGADAGCFCTPRNDCPDPGVSNHVLFSESPPRRFAPRVVGLSARAPRPRSVGRGELLQGLLPPAREGRPDGGARAVRRHRQGP